MVKEGGVVVEWWWWKGGVVVVDPPTSSTEIQRRWVGLTPDQVVVEWRWSGGGGPCHPLYRDTEEVGGLDTKCCCLAVLEWTSVGRWKCQSRLPAPGSRLPAKRWPCFLPNESFAVLSLDAEIQRWMVALIATSLCLQTNRFLILQRQAEWCPHSIHPVNQTVETGGNSGQVAACQMFPWSVAPSGHLWASLFGLLASIYGPLGGHLWASICGLHLHLCREDTSNVPFVTIVIDSMYSLGSPSL